MSVADLWGAKTTLRLLKQAGYEDALKKMKKREKNRQIMLAECMVLPGKVPKLDNDL